MPNSVQNVFCVLLPVPGGGRKYVPLTENGAPLTKADFLNPDTPNPDILGQLDKHDIAAWQLSADARDKFVSSRMVGTVLDLSTAELLEDYNRADALETLTNTLVGWANGSGLGPEQLQALWNSDEEFTNYSNKLLRCQALRERARALKGELSTTAKEKTERCNVWLRVKTSVS